MDLAIAFYGTRDRKVVLGEIMEAHYLVQSLEATSHYALRTKPYVLTVFTSFGVALVKDRRRFGTLVDIEDEIMAWPVSFGARLITGNLLSSTFKAFTDVRYRWLGLEYTKKTEFNWLRQEDPKTEFDLGGWFLQFGVGYWL